MRRLLAALALGLSLSVGAAGQECADVNSILSLSRSVIEKRTELPRLPGRRFGAEPAYLILRYGGLEEPAAAELLDALVAAGVHNAEDLAMARTITMDGADAVDDDALRRATSITGVSTARALLLRGGAGRLFAEIAKGDDPVYPATTVMVAVLDQADATKAALASEATEAGLPFVAAALVATASDPALWTAFAKTLDAETLARVTQMLRWAPAMVGNPELPRTTPAADPAISLKLHNLMITAALEPQLDYLMTLLNMSGWIDEVSTVSDTLRAAIEAGEIDRDGTFDAAWLLAYRALLDSGLTEPTLRGMLSDITQNDARAGRSSVLDTLEWIVAVEALGPYVRGETDEAPGAPRHLTDTWERWLQAAEAVRDGGVPLVTDDTLPRIAELLYARGAFGDLALAIAAGEPSTTLISLATDIARRLDRRCQAYLQHPAEAVQLPGQPIFKFD